MTDLQMPEPFLPPSSAKTRPRVFLVIVDDSSEMRAALRYACNRARATKGRVALLRVIAPIERQHFKSIDALMEQEAQSEAEALLHRLASTVNELSGHLPSFYIRKGNTYDELLALISSEPSISILILAAGTGPEGPGPLVTALTGKHVNKLRVPVTIVPGALSDAEIDAHS